MPACYVEPPHVERSKRCLIGPQHVRDDRFRSHLLLFQQLAKELKRSASVASALHQDVEYLFLGIDGATQIHRPTSDRDEHLVEMPSSNRLGTYSPEPLRVDGAELRRPAADGLVADVQAAFGQQIFDVPEAELKTQVEPHRVLDHARRELVTGVRDWVHRRTLPAATAHANVLVTVSFELRKPLLDSPALGREN